MIMKGREKRDTESPASGQTVVLSFALLHERLEKGSKQRRRKEKSKNQNNAR